MNERKRYKTQLIKCPKCFQLVELKGVSDISLRCAMEDLYVKVEYHLNYQCFFRGRNSKKEKSSIFVSICTEKDNKFNTQWEDNHYFLL